MMPLREARRSWYHNALALVLVQACMEILVQATITLSSEVPVQVCTAPSHLCIRVLVHGMQIWM